MKGIQFQKNLKIHGLKINQDLFDHHRIPQGEDWNKKVEASPRNTYSKQENHKQKQNNIKEKELLEE